MDEIKKGNVTEYYIDNDLLLTIEKLGENRFKVVNNSCKIVGSAIKIDDYNGSLSIEEHYTKGKNGRFYKSRKLFDDNARWFYYILGEKGFI